ncbi:hypothetical protein BB560_003739 [Smittium megazygosporum]|uniref:Uncharacterized protein n=1 Tax=Smittium megazygosporum TaxID=133381 RepID=A0A2T9ZB40_9FUNG|nr:hypothetical protein BB560_003739 [Smittium megazygosporum]
MDSHSTAKISPSSRETYKPGTASVENENENSSTTNNNQSSEGPLQTDQNSPHAKSSNLKSHFQEEFSIIKTQVTPVELEKLARFIAKSAETGSEKLDHDFSNTTQNSDSSAQGQSNTQNHSTFELPC